MINKNPFLIGLRTHFTQDQIERLGSVRVGIAGAGGLGSNCAAYLVRSGVQRLIIADFDVVEASNLNRQFFFLDQVGMAKVAALEENLKRINPDLMLDRVALRLTADNVAKVFDPCAVIVEALDKAQDKKMMAEAFMAGPRLFISASGVAGWGDSDRIRSRRLKEHFFLVGDGRSQVSRAVPPTAAIIGLTAAKQADLVIESILNRAT